MGLPRPENVFGRIDVGVLRMTAGDAPERLLVRPVLRRHMTTSGACLACVTGGDPDQASSPASSACNSDILHSSLFSNLHL